MCQKVQNLRKSTKFVEKFKIWQKVQNLNKKDQVGKSSDLEKNEQKFEKKNQNLKKKKFKVWLKTHKIWINNFECNGIG